MQPVPKPGWGWAPRRLPTRIPANYSKPHGVRFFFGCYDVGADQVFGLWFPRKGADNVIRTLRLIRRRFPGETRIHVVMDNLSSHWTDDVRAWAEANNVELVATPTYASWLNLIEAEFGQLVAFCFAGSDHAGHEEIRRAVSAYLRRRNHEARRDFAHRRREKAKARERRRRARAGKQARLALAHAVVRRAGLLPAA